MGKKRGSAAKKRGPAAPKRSLRRVEPQQPQKKGGVLGGPRRFARDVQGELKKVTWPNREQLRQSTAVVLIIVLILAAYVAAWDFVFDRLARLIFL